MMAKAGNLRSGHPVQAMEQCSTVTYSDTPFTTPFTTPFAELAAKLATQLSAKPIAK
jgi:hypothetical protein